jgi:ABC-2 type transport system ATP-binding protein
MASAEPLQSPIPWAVSEAGPAFTAGPASGLDFKAASPAVWCSGISKSYGKRQALSSVSLQVERGQVLGLLGPNGAGKTSLIKILLGLVHADAGEVMLLGRPSSDPGSRARVGYLPELFRYQPWLSADEVLTLHARLLRLPHLAAHRVVRGELLELVGLTGRGADRVGGFSKGMQQRLGLAVALLGEPDLVVLDEPTSALDPLGRVDVREVVRTLKGRGTTVLLNSHLISEVEQVCDRVVILDHGRVAAAGSLDELLGASQVRLHLGGLNPDVEALLEAAGAHTWAGEWVTVGGVAAAAVPALVAELVGVGAQIFAVEPGRVTLEERLLAVLRGPEPGDSQPDGSQAGGSDQVGNQTIQEVAR